MLRSIISIVNNFFLFDLLFDEFQLSSSIISYLLVTYVTFLYSDSKLSYLTEVNFNHF